MIVAPVLILTVVFSVVKMYKGKHIINTMEDESFNLAAGYFKNKKHIRSIIYLMSYPVSIVGLIFALISLVCMWILVITK